MIIRLNSIQNRHIKRFIEHIVYLTIVVILIPGFFYMGIFIILPAVVEVGTVEYFVHISSAMFLLLNIVGNLIYGVFTDTSIRRIPLKPVTNENWVFCEDCQCIRPPRAWHCDLCGVCILKRDHHCSYFASCIGYYNHRYFIYFTMYVFIATSYSLIYLTQFVAQFVTWNHGLALAKFLFPLASFVFDAGLEALYLFFALINTVVVIFTGFLFFYHLKHVLKGTTVPEMRHSKLIYDKGWKRNMREVFGQRWYLTWLLPFIHSPLPGDGTHWESEDKSK